MRRQERERLKPNRTALITGASRGIGAAIARRLAEDGADVVLQYRSSAELADELAASLRDLGVRSIAVACDLRSKASLGQLKAQLDSAGWTPNVVVHCAGFAHYGLLEDLEEDVWDDLLQVHLTSAFRLTKLFGPSMSWGRWGRFIYLSSVWGIVGAAGEAAYAASKGGLNAFSKSMAKELASFGVTVNAVAPGVVDTDMMAPLSDMEREELRGQIPLGRFADADEIAQLVRFLVSDDAGYLTGQVLGMTGGWQI
jgi:3-oxoacyl-[acyl-carrier protein] reductase